MIRSALLAALIAMGLPALAKPTPMKVKPLGKDGAPSGGTFLYNISSEPENFSPLNSQEAVAREVYHYAVEGLLRINEDNYAIEPELAESYEVSKDSLTYTFHLNKDAKFSDGHPVTSEDVRFSIEAVKDPAYMAAHRMPYYEDVASIETPDPLTVVVKMKRKYFKNLEVIGTPGYTPILPKHIYGDPKKKFPGAPIFGSGPYTVEAYNRGKNIILTRNPDYWGKNLASKKNIAKFEKLNARFIKDENLELEMVRKGQLDTMFPIRPEIYEKKAVGEPFGTTIKKVEAENDRPKNWGFIGWNEKNPMFQDVNTRVALSHLLNRKLLMEKFMFNKVVEAVGPVYYRSPFMPKDLKPLSFDPAKAKALLKKVGWEDADKNGVLEKTIDGKKQEFRFTLMHSNRDVEKYFTIYKEGLKEAGIEMEIKYVEWNTFAKLLEEQKFDAVSLAWAGGSPEGDMKQIWHSESARMGGSNFVSYKNVEVDKAIDQAREELNAEKRKKLWQKAVRLIVQDAPYTFLFNNKFDIYLLNSRIGQEKPTYTYDLGADYWYVTK